MFIFSQATFASYDRITIIFQDGSNRKILEENFLGVETETFAAVDLQNLATNHELESSFVESVDNSLLVLFGEMIPLATHKAVFGSEAITAAFDRLLERGGMLYFNYQSWTNLSQLPNEKKSYFAKIGAFCRNHNLTLNIDGNRFGVMNPEQPHYLTTTPNELSAGNWKWAEQITLQGYKVDTLPEGPMQIMLAMDSNRTMYNDICLAMLQENILGEGMILHDTMYGSLRSASKFMKNITHNLYIAPATFFEVIPTVENIRVSDEIKGNIFVRKDNFGLAAKYNGLVTIRLLDQNGRIIDTDKYSPNQILINDGKAEFSLSLHKDIEIPEKVTVQVVDGSIEGSSDEIEIAPSDPAQITISIGNSYILIGRSVEAEIQVLDDNGYGSPKKRVIFDDSEGFEIFPASEILTNAYGKATITIEAGQSEGNWTLLAQVADTTIETTQEIIIVNEAIVIEPEDLQGVVGKEINVLVKVLNMQNQPIEGRVLQVSCSGNGSLNQTETNTDSNGEAVVVWTLATTVGTNELVVQASDLGLAESITVTGIADEPKRIQIEYLPLGELVINKATSHAIISVTDQYKNVVNDGTPVIIAYLEEQYETTTDNGIVEQLICANPGELLVLDVVAGSISEQIEINVPNVPNIIAPIMNEIIMSSNVMFEWESDAEDTVYRIDCASDPNLKNIVLAEDNIQNKYLEAELSGGELYWRLVSNENGFLVSNSVSAFKVVTADSLARVPFLKIQPSRVNSQGNAVIHWACSENAEVNLLIFNLAGKLVYSLEYQGFEGIEHGGLINDQIEWAGVNNQDMELPNGLYICQIIIRTDSRSLKLTDRIYILR